MIGLKITLSLLLLSLACCGIIMDTIVQRQATNLTALDTLRTAQLNQHNVYRSKHGGPGLVLDATLNNVAQDWANYLLSIKKLVHKTNNPYGQNLFVRKAFPTLAPAVAPASVSWYSEISNYDHATGQPKATGLVIGHYTQLVWKASTKVGFGFASGTQIILSKGRNITFQVQYVVAEYDRPGNYVGQYTTNVIAPTP